MNPTNTEVSKERDLNPPEPQEPHNLEELLGDEVLDYILRETPETVSVMIPYPDGEEREHTVLVRDFLTITITKREREGRSK